MATKRSNFKPFSQVPSEQGLYNPQNEHDACGVGFVAHIKGKKSHEIVTQGLKILENLDHRGAVGADPAEIPGSVHPRLRKSLPCDAPCFGSR